MVPSEASKVAVTMEDWEAKSPLNELEIKSVNTLKDLCEERRLPLKVTDSLIYYYTTVAVA